jgi:5-methylcytosine-specific restriction endonuclease McrA
MNKCKKCESEFIPCKGLVNYCSMECRQSRERPESVRQKISKGVKSNGYLQSTEWLKSISEANCNKNRIKKVKETWVSKRDYENSHIGTLKRYYLENKHSCEQCGLSEWMNYPITLEVHHKDSDVNNNNFENFQALCPNCHSLTEGWRGRKRVNPNDNSK